jgi:hypothetical protein
MRLAYFWRPNVVAKKAAILGTSVTTENLQEDEINRLLILSAEQTDLLDEMAQIRYLERFFLIILNW